MIKVKNDGNRWKSIEICKTRKLHFYMLKTIFVWLI
jgi:hypothetical protein